MLVLEFVEGVSLYQVALVAGHRAGSFVCVCVCVCVCVAGSSIIFNEDLPCWNVRRRGRKRGLSSLVAGCSLPVTTSKKRQKKKFL